MGPRGYAPLPHAGCCGSRIMSGTILGGRSAHRPEDGPLGKAGYMAFIEADGSLRPGHGVFNEF